MSSITPQSADGSRFPHEAEAIQALLGKVRSANLEVPQILCNYEVYDKATNDYYECDVVIVCGFGVFVTELKHWTGHIQVAPRTWIVNGSQYRPDPHLSNRFKCKILRGIYRHSFTTFPDLWFESVVILTNHDAEVVHPSAAKTDQHNPTFFGIDRFIDYLRNKLDDYTGPRLTSEQIKAVAAKFEGLRVKEAKGYNFPGYEVVERLTQRANLIELIVRPKEGRRRGLQRFRIFSPPHSSQHERELFLRRANNTLDALAKIGDHPNLLRVWSVPNEYGQIIEASEWSEEGTIADLIDQNAGGIPRERVLPMIKGILEGLCAVHREAIIHRMLSPENVLLCGQVPRLMNFDLAYQLEDNHVTVIPDVSTLKSSPFTAPEVYLKQEPSEATDLFSVGVILFEMLTGQLPFKASSDLAASGGYLAPEKMQLLIAKTSGTIPVSEVVAFLLEFDPKKRFQRAEEVLEMLFPKVPGESGPKSVNRELTRGETYDLYQIDALIATGGHSQTYRAIQGSQQERIALKVFNADVSQDRAWAELRAAQAVDSPYAVRVESLGHWQAERFFLAMNLVEGTSLRTEVKEHRLPAVDPFIEVAQALLQAVQQLHERKVDGKCLPLLHNDIKPDNVLLRAENHPVLIDFGLACSPGVATYVGTEGYVAPDLRDGADLEFCESGDLFALGTTLFEWFYGVRPYERPIVGATCRDVSSFREHSLPVPIYDWLVRAVATTKNKRFASAKDMLQSLTMAWVRARTPAPQPEPKPAPEIEPIEIRVPEVTLRNDGGCGSQSDVGDAPLGNPFLAYLNSLHNTTGSNENALAESQALNRFFGVIHVRSAVADFAHKQMTGSDRRHIILTGHAGDGKSTIGLELFKTLKGLPMGEPLAVPLKAIEEIHLPGKPPITMVKDMSELSGANRLSILNRACSTNPERFFIISNTGTLLESFRAMTKGANQWIEMESRLLEALSAQPPSFLTQSDGNFDVVNLVQVDNLSIALDIF